MGSPLRQLRYNWHLSCKTDINKEDAATATAAEAETTQVATDLHWHYIPTRPAAEAAKIRFDAPGQRLLSLGSRLAKDGLAPFWYAAAKEAEIKAYNEWLLQHNVIYNSVLPLQLDFYDLQEILTLRVTPMSPYAQGCA